MADFDFFNFDDLNPGNFSLANTTFPSLIQILIPALTIPLVLCSVSPNLCFLNLLMPRLPDQIQQPPQQPQQPQPDNNPDIIVPLLRIPDPNENFDTFLITCGKAYVDQLEMDQRRGIFEKNVEIIREVNEAFDNGRSSYELRVNCFGDLELEEFATEYLGLGVLRGDRALGGEESLRRKSFANRRDYSPLPYSIDWAQRGAVTPVLDQSPCNSCAAHAATSTIESCLWKATGFLPPPLSQQQLVDCTAGLTVDNGTELERSNQGCVSGFPDVHLKFVKEQGGSVQTAEEYPLEPERQSGKCLTRDYFHTKVGTNAVTPRLEDFEFEFFSDEEDLKHMVGLGGPTVTNVDVTAHWQFYGGGVYYSEDQCVSYENEQVPYGCQRNKEHKLGYTCLGHCKQEMPQHCDRFFVPSETSFPHSLIVVGYGTDEYGWDFWRMKNSWGTMWGEDGFIRLHRGLGHCGVGSYVSQAICN